MNSSPLLRTQKLTKRFGGLTAVSDVDLEIRPSEILGLIGPNGAGKSTLFRLIAGISRPSSGIVEFAGRRLSGKRASTVCRAGVAVTHQIVRPFGPLTVLENVRVGAYYGKPKRPRREQAQEIAFDVLGTCGLLERANDLARTLTLAGQKRLEIARALATRPRLLLLDEVLAGLNPAEIDRTLELIRAINAAGVTIVIVEHNLRAVRGACSRLAVLDEGRKIADGDPAAVLADPGVVEAYLGAASA